MRQCSDELDPNFPLNINNKECWKIPVTNIKLPFDNSFTRVVACLKLFLTSHCQRNLGLMLRFTC